MKRGVFSVIRKIVLTYIVTLVAFLGLVNGFMSSPVRALAPNAPTELSSKNGVTSQNTAPPSTTIAVSPTETMQLTNAGWQISINSSTKTYSGTNAQLINTTGTFISDPQVMWDDSTKRFYFSFFENNGTTTPNEGIVWGFSKSAKPEKASGFCSYFNGFNYGSTSFPDRQSLGDSNNFLLFGSNRYSTSTEGLISSDLAWISKPPAGKTCPAASSFTSGIQTITNPDGSPVYTPTPSKQIDSSSVGTVIGTPSQFSSSALTIFSVTKSPVGNGAVISSPSSIAVPYYSFPPGAPQAGSKISGGPAPNLDTQVYLSQAIFSFDPRLGHNTIWTAHTVAGGAGSEVRWYEINPVNNTIDQTGTISDPNMYVFNPTISSDRIVNAKKTAFGDSALIDVNTSSSNNYPAIQMASTLHGQPMSALVMVKQSLGPNIDFSCFEPNISTCRWGDYSGSMPNPSAPLTGAHGQVIFTSEWNNPDLNDETPVWQTLLGKAQL